MRALRLFGAALVGLLALAPAVATPAAAATPRLPAAWISCDPTAATISSGIYWTGLAAGRKVVATFTVASRRSVSATEVRYLPSLPETVVPATVAANGTIELSGYTRAWDPAAHLSYTETVRVTLKYDDGASAASPAVANCYHDTRTSVEVTCGGAAAPRFAVTTTGVAATAGTKDPLLYPARIEYRQIISERPAGSAFTSHYQSTVSHRIVRDTQTGDTWSNQGPSKDLSRTAVYTVRLEVVISDAFGGRLGGAFASCDYNATAAV